MRKRLLLVLFATISMVVLLTGCFQGEQSLKDMDPPQNAEAVGGQDSPASNSEEESSEGLRKKLKKLSVNYSYWIPMEWLHLNL